MKKFLGNKFTPQSKKDQRATEAKKKKIEEKISSAKEIVIECLQSDNFRKYRKELEIANKGMIEVGIETMKTIIDPMKRVFVYDALFVKAEILNSLLNQVEDDARK